MSLGSSVHTIGFHKDMAGWIPEARRAVFRDTGARTVTIAPLSEPEVNGAFLGVIPLDDEGRRFYTVEARRRTSHDFLVPADGVLIHLVDLNRGDRAAQVVDATLDANPSDAGATWTPGETYTDPERGLAVSVDAAAGRGYTVTVTRWRAGPDACVEVVPAGHWKGEYFATGRSFGAVAIRDDGAGSLSPDLDPQGPFPACGARDGFSARWTRDVTLAEGVYRIAIVLAGGARVRVDGRTVFDRYREPTSLATFDVDVALTAGRHQLEVTYRDAIHMPALSVTLGQPRPGFRIEVDGAPRLVAPGTSAPFTVRLVGMGGFRSPVALTASPGAAGEVHLDAATIRPGESSGATLSVASGAPGMLAVRLEARSGSLAASHRILVRTRVGFTIQCVPGAVDTVYGSKGEFTVSIVRDPGMTGPVEVRIPAGFPSFLKVKPASAATEGDRVVFRYKARKLKGRPESFVELSCVATHATGGTQFSAVRLAVR
jgi:hypothetical protein